MVTPTSWPPTVSNPCPWICPRCPGSWPCMWISPGVGVRPLGPLSPFVGGGLGATRVASGETRMTFPKTRTLVSGTRRTALTWRLTAGLGMSWGERATLDLAWRYTDAGVIETGAGPGPGSNGSTVAGTCSLVQYRHGTYTIRRGGAVGVARGPLRGAMPLNPGDGGRRQRPVPPERLLYWPRAGEGERVPPHLERHRGQPPDAVRPAPLSGIDQPAGQRRGVPRQHADGHPAQRVRPGGAGP